MIDGKLASHLVKDILETGEYSISGIAYHAQTTEDVVYDIVTGQNKDPSSKLFRKLVKLHQSSRPDLYQEILKKVLSEK